MLIKILKSSFLFQNLASWFVAMIPSVVSHNISKYSALKKAMYLTALERLDGDYLEFGVFTGSSFVFALRMHQKLAYLGALTTRFFGFDSFTGFGNISEGDKHPFYLDEIFSVNADKVIKNIKRHAGKSDVQIVKGYFQDSLKDKTPADFGIKRARVVFIDCDLKDPASIVLQFVRPAIQCGTILVMDDFCSYRGDVTKGVAGAFEEFKKIAPELEWRRVTDYGMGGVVFICSKGPWAA